MLALLGSSGFIGQRLLEILHLRENLPLRPIIHTHAGLARVARFDLDWRRADTRDPSALQQAFQDCHTIVDASIASPADIPRAAHAIHTAARHARVQRLIYLSSASVHRQNPDPGTNEQTPLPTTRQLDYNLAKIHAERILQKLHRQALPHTPELIILRPGIVYGPRSRWITHPAHTLRHRTAHLHHHGAGICNALYVDNLAHAILLALRAPAPQVNGQAFLLNDSETLTWLDYTTPIARHLGIDPATIPSPPLPSFHPTWASRLHALRASAPVQSLLPHFPTRLKDTVKAALHAWTHPLLPHDPLHFPGELPPLPPAPQLTRELALLHSCQWRLPTDKARHLLNYHPPVPFPLAMQRSLAWLDTQPLTPP